MTGKKLVYICCCFSGLPGSSGFKLSGSGFQIATPGRGMTVGEDQQKKPESYTLIFFFVEKNKERFITYLSLFQPQYQS